jgi:hypothetical protein
MKIYPLILLALLVSVTAQAQKNTNPERARLLKSTLKDKDTKIVAVRNISSYAFAVEGESLSVVNDNTIDLISLAGNLNYVKHVFYNDNIKIEDEGLKYTTGKSIKKESSCGHYEVEDVFYSDAKVCSYKFNFLYEGTEISFSSRTRFTDPRYFTRIFFHDNEPAAAREITIAVPGQVEVDLVEKNFDGYDIKKTVTQRDGKTFYNYKVTNLQDMKSEPNSLGALYYYPHLVVLTKKFKTASGEKTVLAKVDDLYKWYHGLVEQVTNDPAPFKEQVQKLTASAKTPEEKIKAIYYWVQDNIKYIAFEDGLAGFRPEAAQTVYANRYGDCKGMANLTKEMLKVAGFDARLTWIGTNRIPYTYDLPSLGVDNHMICTVMTGDKQYILDSTEKYIALGKNAERIQGKEMLIENGDGFIRKKVPVSDFSANLVSRSETITLTGGALSGKGELTMNGEAKKNILYFSTNVKQEDQKKVFDNLAVIDYSNTDKVEITNTPPVDREKPLEVQYSFSLANKVSQFGNDLYVDLDWNKTFQDMVIEDSRVSDYYFNRKVKLKTLKKLKLPTGYKVTHLPAGMSKKHSDFAIEVSFKQVGNEVVYTNEITVNQGLIRKQHFSEWNNYIKELKEVYNDQLVLTKAK